MASARNEVVELGFSQNIIVVEIDGTTIHGLLQAAITSTNCFAADSYSLTFATGDPPLSSVRVWSAVSNARVEVSAGDAPGSNLTPLITGMVDSIYIDAIRNTVAIEGRDLSSALVDSYRQGDFVNQTAAEIVANVANRYGLDAVITPTADIIGRYYGDGYTRLSTGQFSRLQSDWDLVVELARENDFDVFVQGSQLFFQPSAPYPSVFTSIAPNLVQNLRLSRSLGLGSCNTARVQSWSSQNMAAYDSNGGNGNNDLVQPAFGSASQPYLFSTSNLTSAQVTQAAARYTAEISRHQTTMLVEMPWDLRISPRSGIMLSGTDSMFDGPYLVDSVERFHSSTSGSTQTVNAVSVAGFGAILEGP